ncbi:hypothetical protein BB561_004802 [Smittium simulii]|uniref:Uncharacterized protein n=1 Tax=Smittium simulii TaxID=133385 RepID=A0A2T9YE65_9FUNG|nr:hypothetical protein BB561_004802 [Smittium simulii]
MRAVTFLSLCISCIFYKAVSAAVKNAVVDSYPYPTPSNISYATMKEKCIIKYGSEVFLRDNEQCTCLDDGKIDCIRIGYPESKLETCIRVQGRGKNPYISENRACICMTDGTSVFFLRDDEQCICLDDGKIECFKLDNPNYKLETCARVQGRGKNPYILDNRACACMTDGTSVCGPVYDTTTSTTTEISVEKKNCIDFMPRLQKNALLLLETCICVQGRGKNPYISENRACICMTDGTSVFFLRDDEQCICLDDGKIECFKLDNPNYKLETCARVQGRGKNPYIWENRACICMADGSSVCGPAYTPTS